MIFTAWDPGWNTGFALVQTRADDSIGAVAFGSFGDSPDSTEEVAQRWTAHKRLADDWGAGLVVGYETFILRGGSIARQQAQGSSAKMPSSQVIGMLKMLAHLDGVQLVPITPNAKKAGRLSMPPALADARARATNEHQRDALDLCAFLIRSHTVARGH